MFFNHLNLFYREKIHENSLRGEEIVAKHVSIETNFKSEASDLESSVKGNPNSQLYSYSIPFFVYRTY